MGNARLAVGTGTRTWFTFISDIQLLDGNVENKANKERVKSGELSLDHFVVGWSKPDPVTITFDLAQTAEIERVRVLYSRSRPSLAVELSRNGRNFQRVATASGYPLTDDALDAVLTFPPQAAEYVRITIGRRRSGDRLVLSEIEVGGQ